MKPVSHRPKQNRIDLVSDLNKLIGLGLKATLDLEMWTRKKTQANYELNVFIDYVKEHVDSQEKLEESSEWNEEEERKYNT